MRLEIGTFNVAETAFGERTRLQDGQLEIDRQELLDLVLEDAHIPWADVDIVHPGDSVRLVNIRDLLEPKIKVEGPGTVYPGVCGRSLDTVGQGLTYRLGNVAVMLCVDTDELTPKQRSWPHEPQPQDVDQPAGGRAQRFMDMSGPGNLPPYDSLTLVCLSLKAPTGLNDEDRYVAIYSAALRVTDRLAHITIDQEPTEIETLDLTKTDDALPGFVFIPHLASGEWQAEAGPRSNFGAAIYGQTRLSAPWLLYPTEMLDGAVFGTYNIGRPASWQLSNNPVVTGLARRHGVTCNFLGCIIQRTNWTTQPEKEMAATRAALLAKRLGASGAIVTTDLRGQRFLETALTVQACERQGIKTVLLTEEEDNEEGTAPPLLVSFPEIASVVSAGTGGVDEPFPAVSRVVGAQNPDAQWLKEREPIHGAYGSFYLSDYYGYGYNSFEDY